MVKKVYLHPHMTNSQLSLTLLCHSLSLDNYSLEQTLPQKTEPDSSSDG
jgi:hypothetical protein